jgi:hypothetical protein
MSCHGKLMDKFEQQHHIALYSRHISRWLCIDFHTAAYQPYRATDAMHRVASHRIASPTFS